MDKEGYGEEINRKNMGQNKPPLYFENWTDDQFKLFCALSGCDYVPKIKQLGIKSAYNLVREHGTISKLSSALLKSNFQGVNVEYLIQLERAWLTFKYQVSYEHIFFNNTPPNNLYIFRLFMIPEAIL